MTTPAQRLPSGPVAHKARLHTRELLCHAWDSIHSGDRERIASGLTFLESMGLPLERCPNPHGLTDAQAIELVWRIKTRGP